MASLGGHRGNFTWALNKYNSTDDPIAREKFAKHMAHYIRAAQADGYSAEAITQSQSYPVDEIKKHFDSPASGEIPEMTESQVQEKFAEKIDMTSVAKLGSGNEIVYAYGYNCAPDRLKIGMTEVDCVQRIVQQINASTPDRPVLYVEIKTNHCRSLERAMHNILEHRGKKISCGGDEWFSTSVQDIIDIYHFVTKESPQ